MVESASVFVLPIRLLDVMRLLLLGINHNSAPLSLRERVAFVPEQIHVALRDGVAAGLGEEIAILSTCNRTEILLHWPLMVMRRGASGRFSTGCRASTTSITFN